MRSLTHQSTVFLAVQHERKPIVDRKDPHKNSTSENDMNSSEMTQSKSRLKKDSTNDSVNYLSLFQLNPLLMHAASGIHQTQNFQVSPKKTTELTGIKMEEPFIDDIGDNKTIVEGMETFESAFEQKLFEMITTIETSLHTGYDGYNNGTSDDNLTDSFLGNLNDENLTQFKIQLPNLLPKMHFVCEVGSRILFKSIDWLKDMRVWSHFDEEVQNEMVKLHWAELLVLGLAQTISTSSQSGQLKAMIVSTLVNYVKSLILYSSNEPINPSKLSGKVEDKPPSGPKLKKMLINIMMINKFIDAIIQLELNTIEFAHLRVLCMFNPYKCYSSDTKLKNYYQKVASSLQNYLRSREKSQVSAQDRMVSIYQALSSLPSFDSKIIEKLFFNILVDFIRIDNIIPYIINLNPETGDHNQNVKREELDLNDENNSLSLNSDDQRYYNYSGDEK